MPSPPPIFIAEELENNGRALSIRFLIGVNADLTPTRYRDERLHPRPHAMALPGFSVSELIKGLDSLRTMYRGFKPNQEGIASQLQDLATTCRDIQHMLQILEPMFRGIEMFRIPSTMKPKLQYCQQFVTRYMESRGVPWALRMADLALHPGEITTLRSQLHIEIDKLVLFSVVFGL
jgi:hypothetical protein